VPPGWLPGAGQALEDHLYIVDPMGEWMMRARRQPSRQRSSATSTAAARLGRLGPGRAAEPHGTRTTADLVDLAPLRCCWRCWPGAALLPLAWVWLRARGADTRTRLAALTALTLFLTFDLIVFGAFTRLTDSGLGCPDWPGCYGEASPLGARADIARRADGACPGGPVTWSKAWIEMIHRYLAMTVGVLILVMAASWQLAGRAAAALALVAHADAGVGARAGPVRQVHRHAEALPGHRHAAPAGRAAAAGAAGGAARGLPARPLALAAGRAPAAGALVLALLVVQIALGGWVSTNYAVLACTGFPHLQRPVVAGDGLRHGFTLLRELGQTATARCAALRGAGGHPHGAPAVRAGGGGAGAGALAWRCGARRSAALRPLRRRAGAAALAAGGQRLSNVVLGWPLARRWRTRPARRRWCCC
jgi:heme a synthase